MDKELAYAVVKLIGIGGSVAMDYLHHQHCENTESFQYDTKCCGVMMYDRFRASALAHKYEERYSPVSPEYFMKAIKILDEADDTLIIFKKAVKCLSDQMRVSFRNLGGMSICTDNQK